MKTFREFLEIANIQLDEGIRNPDVPRRPLDQFLKAKEIMKNNAKEAERKGSTNNLIRSRKPAEPRTPDRVGNPSAATPSGEGLNPEKKPPRPRVVTPYVPPEGEGTLAARTAKIRPFGTVYEPPAAPIKKQK